MRGLEKGSWYVLAGALCFSTTGFCQAQAPEGATPWVIGALRMLTGCLALWAWCCLKGRHPLREAWSTVEKVRHILPAGLSLAGYQMFFFQGVLDAGVSTGTVVAIGIAPIFVALLALVVLREKPARVWYASTLLAVCGLVLLNWEGMGSSAGFVCGRPLAAGFCYACYYVFSKPLTARHAPEPVMAMLFLVGALCMLPVLVFLPTAWVWSVRGMVVVLSIGLVATALAYTLTLTGLRTLSASTAATLALAEPLGAAVLGITVLGERLSITGAVAMGLMLLGVLLLALPAGRGDTGR